MSFVPVLHSLASVAFERLLYSLAEGSFLALAVALGLRFIPQRSSRTIFVIWFSALLASALLPIVGLNWSKAVAGGPDPRALITVPVSVAFYASLAWLMAASAGLARVIAGIWQLRELRQGCQEAGEEQLGLELSQMVTDFRKRRPVSILISHRLQVPTAIGFFRPAVIIPAWMAEEGPSNELKHVLLHELSHLGRCDDWSNLVQKILGALLFFHPGVWWMQRELSIHREMACDDLVLARTASPRTYAECLARVAEKSFLRRQVALAQAAVSRMRQLTRRVNRMLDPNQRLTTQVWKPAIPAVATLALLAGISGSWAPGLIRVQDDTKVVSASQARVGITPSLAPATTAERTSYSRSWQAGLRTSESPARSTSLILEATHKAANARHAIAPRKTMRPRAVEHTPMMLTANRETALKPNRPASEQQDGFVLVVETRQTVREGPDGWQISVQQLRWLVPISRIQKSLPSKI